MTAQSSGPDVQAEDDLSVENLHREGGAGFPRFAVAALPVQTRKTQR